MHAHFGRKGYQAGLLQLHRPLPDLATFAEWPEGGLRRAAWAA
jgi:hypothetical protein